MIQKTWFFIAVLLLSHVLVHGQSLDSDLVVKFENLTVEDKLPSHRVLCVCQDQRGFMWFGTEEGLCRYDGNHFVEFFADINDPYSLRNHAVRAIVEDQFGNLWIGTDGGGLHYFDQRSLRFYSYPLPYQHLDHKNSLPGKVFAILRTSQEKYWIGSYGQGLYILPTYNSPQDVIKRCESQNPDGVIQILPGRTMESLHDLNVFSLFEDNNNEIWIGTDDYGTDEGGALHKLIKEGSKPQEYKFKQYRSIPNDTSTLGSNYIMSMFEDSKGRFWVCNWEGGLNLVDRESGTVKRFREGNEPVQLNCDDIYSITEDEQGNLWVATYGGGICMMDESADEIMFWPYMKHESSQNSLIGNYVRQIFTDQSGLLWAITWKSGISRIRISKNPFIHVPLRNHLKTDTITEVVEDLRLTSENEIALYTQEQGYMILNVKPATLNYNYSVLSSPDQWPEDPIRQTKLVQSNAGVHAFELLIKDSRVFLEATNGDLWIGKGNSLHHIKQNPSSGYITEEFERNSQDPTSLKGYHVTGIVEDRNGTIWVSSFDGLNYFNAESKTFHYFTMKDGLPGNAISGMLIDDHNFIWLATDNGIARFDPVSKTTLSYSLADGLPFKEFSVRIGFGMEDFQNFPSYLKLQDGRFIFSSTRHGFVIFNPEDVYGNMDEPRTWISELKIMNEPVPPFELKVGLKETGTDISYAKSVYLNQDDKSFSLSISVLDYYSAGFTQFAYKLKPIYVDWRYLDPGLDEVTFSLLPHGEYLLEVIGANSDGIWNSEPRQLKIHIPMPWWSRAWFRLSVLVMLALAGALIIIRSKQRNQILNALSIERLRSEEQEKFTQMRMRFYTNVTHEFRTQLTLILGPLGKLEKILASTDGRSDLSIMKRNGLRLLNLVNQLMDFRKIETKALHIQVEEGDISAYVKGICDLFNENILSRDIRFRFISSPTQIYGFFDRSAIDKIVFNLLSNSFKYTEKKGRISVELKLFTDSVQNPKTSDSEKVDTVQMIIEDSGSGIPGHLQEKVFDRFYQVNANAEGSGIGLSIVKNLAELHYGQVSLESKEGVGTKFMVQIPISRSAFSENEISDRTIQSSADFSSYRPVVEGVNGKENTNYSNNAEQNKEVLIVEDNPDMLSFIDGLLKREYRTRKASSAENALHILETKEPSIILTDLMMPGIDGLKFIKNLKENPKYSHIPIIIISALVGKEHEIDGLKLGAEDYLRKPFDPEVLLIKIHNLINLRDKFQNNFVNGSARETQNLTVSNRDQEFLNSLLETIDSNYMNASFGVKDLVEIMGMSHSVLLRKVKSLTGQSLNELIVLVRLEKAHQALLQEKLPVKEVAYIAGFSDPKYFSTRFKKKFGQSPSEINS